MNRLREVRVLRRITQFQLRIATGIHQSKISLIENYQIEPCEDEKRKIAKALGVRPTEIWNGEEHTPADGLNNTGKAKQFCQKVHCERI